MQYDLFNGDADGIFALHQYRLKFPTSSSTRITGVKRDIKLLSKIEKVTDAEISVFDISLDSNRVALLKVLGNNNKVSYFDHHFAGDIPKSKLLSYCINPSPDTCTSLLVNEYLKGEFWQWAICGAFGDNLHQTATSLANQNGLTKTETTMLKEVGELFNYNGYGSKLSDLHFSPDELYLAVKPFKNPSDFIKNSTQLKILRDGHKEDMERALAQPQLETPGKNRIYSFPDAPWARRVAGVFSNLRAREKTHLAHAIITENEDGSFRISVRAPLEDKRDAVTLCNKFPTGGGRAAAAGINSLPPNLLEEFINSFESTYN